MVTEVQRTPQNVTGRLARGTPTPSLTSTVKCAKRGTTTAALFCIGIPSAQSRVLCFWSARVTFILRTKPFSGEMVQRPESYYVSVQKDTIWKRVILSPNLKADKGKRMATAPPSGILHDQSSIIHTFSLVTVCPMHPSQDMPSLRVNGSAWGILAPWEIKGRP